MLACDKGSAKKALLAVTYLLTVLLGSETYLPAQARLVFPITLS
jgi:hypothetical protein